MKPLPHIQQAIKNEVSTQGYNYHIYLQNTREVRDFLNKHNFPCEGDINSADTINLYHDKYTIELDLGYSTTPISRLQQLFHDARMGAKLVIGGSYFLKSKKQLLSEGWEETKFEDLRHPDGFLTDSAMDKWLGAEVTIAKVNKTGRVCTLEGISFWSWHTDMFILDSEKYLDIARIYKEL